MSTLFGSVRQCCVLHLAQEKMINPRSPAMTPVPLAGVVCVLVQVWSEPACGLHVRMVHFQLFSCKHICPIRVCLEEVCIPLPSPNPESSTSPSFSFNIQISNFHFYRSSESCIRSRAVQTLISRRKHCLILNLKTANGTFCHSHSTTLDPRSGNPKSKSETERLRRCSQPRL